MKKILFVLIAVLAISCEKDIENVSNKNEQLSAEKLELKENLSKTAELLKYVLTDQKIISELGSFVDSKPYGARIISFDALLNPEVKEVTEKLNLKLTDEFLKRFRRIALSKFSNFTEIESYLIQNNVVLYFPYSTKWDFNNLNEITIAPHPLVTDKEGPGIKYRLGSKSFEEEVLVNNEFVTENPTLIISIDENNDGIIGEPDEGGACPSPTNILQTKYTYDELANPDNAYIVKIKKVQLRMNNDGIFSFKNEIVIKRFGALPDFEGYPIEDCWESTFIIYTANIGNRKWVDFNVSFDSNWSTNQITQGFLCYDYDWYVSSIDKFTFSPSFKYGNVEISASIEGTVKSDEGHIYKATSYNRSSFFHEMYHTEYVDPNGYPVFSFGNVRFSVDIIKAY